MKKALRLFLTGNMQSLFFKQFIKEAADAHEVSGFLRVRQDGRVEVFLEGDKDSVGVVAAIAKRGPKHTQIRTVEEKEERLQDFKEFKVLNF